MRRVLITGIAGFTGRYMAETLRTHGYDVAGIELRNEGQSQLPRPFFSCDLNDGPRLARVISEVRPEIIIHLAGISFVPHGDAKVIYETNLCGTKNLLETLARSNLNFERILLASSSNVYASAPGPIDESAPLAPASDYAISKLAMEMVAKLYVDRLPITVVRPFNYTGVGQSENFFLPKIIAHLKRGEDEIALGNLDAVRDFSDVRSVVACYKKLIESPQAIGETYNVCSGRSYTIRKVIEMAQEIAGRSLKVSVNPSLIREREIQAQQGSRLKLEKAIGPAPDIELAETLRWMINPSGSA